MHVVVNLDNDIMAIGSKCERVDANGEVGLIKVNVTGGFYYLGTNDRDTYVIHTVSAVPVDYPQVKYKFIDNEFVKVE